jgi:hypothetical protein
MEERLTDAEESGSDRDRRPFTDSNNNSQIERKLRKQMEVCLTLTYIYVALHCTVIFTKS